MMPGTRSWRPLPFAVPGIPSLLVCTDFTAHSYSVRITDLANVWTEILEKKPIIMRGLKEDTSIDPTDGPDQIRKLLDLLRAAFDPASPEHGDTSMALSGGSSDAGDDGLTIHITVILPGGLRPLKWPMYLKKSHPSAIATELVLPLVQTHQVRAREVAELVAALHDKDGVISKLVDKLETMGVGLDNVFTSLSSRRRVTMEMAEERVKGLAPFQESEFRKRARGDGEMGPADIPALLDSVFGREGIAHRGGDDSLMDVEESPGLDDWWMKLSKGRPVALVERGKDVSAKRTESPAPRASAWARGKAGKAVEKQGEHDDDDDDDFQVQATPPGRTANKPRTSRAAASVNGDDETSDGEDEEEESNIPDSMPEPSWQKSSTTTTRHAWPASTGAKPSTSRLGAIGKRTQAPPVSSPPRRSPSPSPPLSSLRPAHRRAREWKLEAISVPYADDGSETASDVDSGSDRPRSPSPKQPSSPKTPPARTRRGPALGRIGAGAKAAAAAKERAPSQEAADGASQTPKTTPRRGRLGAIGRGTGGREGDGDGDGDKASSQGKEKRGRSDGGSSGTMKEETKDAEENQGRQRRETSLERADRKRAELQNELQKRAAAGPARKKRKF